jgi:phosphoglycerate dehydrogenase-like enzyme
MARSRFLSPALIARTALETGDRDGPEAMSMRRIATELNCDPMALYRHFANREALLDAVADLALALVLALARRLLPADASLRAGRWEAFPGVELRGRTLGLVGLGVIGKGVAVRAQAFGMQVVAHDPVPDELWAARHGVELAPLGSVLERADVLSLHAAAPGLGRPLLGAEELGRLRPGAIVVNAARGTLVDEVALAEALRTGRVGGAGIDAFERQPPHGSPLLGLDNVVLTPQLAGQTVDALARMAALCVDNTLRALHGERPEAVVE